MTQNSFLNLGKDTLHIIETNGGKIGIDFSETNRINNFEKFQERVNKEFKRFEAENHIIEKRNNQKKNKHGMKWKDRDLIENYNKFLNKITQEIDTILGEGASNKIFYDTVLERVVVSLPRLHVVVNELLPLEFEKAKDKFDKFQVDYKELTSVENREKYLTKDERIDVIE